MLVSNGSRLLYRGIATYENSKIKTSMMAYLKKLPANVCAFDNPTEENILIVDFEKSTDRDDFSKLYGFEIQSRAA